MSIRTAFTALALGLAFSSAFAGNQSVAFSNGAAAFNSAAAAAPVLAGGDDVISFTGLSAGSYNFQLAFSSSDVQNLGLSLNGVVGTVISLYTYSFSGISGSGMTPFELTVTGTPTSSQAAYSGTISVSAIPEPANAALVLAGLGLMGFMAMRRKS